MFDFDYTLFDTSRGVIQCMRHAFATVALAVPDEDAIRRSIGLPLEDAIKHLSDGAASQRCIEEMVRLFLQSADSWMVDGTVPIAPVPQIIRDLRADGLELAIVTGKYRARVERTLRKFEIGSCFDVLVCGDEVAKKPDPEGIRRVMARYTGLAATQFAFIGDHYLDILTARNAGVDSIAVATGQVTVDILASYSPHAVVRSLGELRPTAPVRAFRDQ